MGLPLHSRPEAPTWTPCPTCACCVPGWQELRALSQESWCHEAQCAQEAALCWPHPSLPSTLPPRHRAVHQLTCHHVHPRPAQGRVTARSGKGGPRAPRPFALTGGTRHDDNSGQAAGRPRSDDRVWKRFTGDAPRPLSLRCGSPACSPEWTYGVLAARGGPPGRLSNPPCTGGDWGWDVSPGTRTAPTRAGAVRRWGTPCGQRSFPLERRTCWEPAPPCPESPASEPPPRVRAGPGVGQRQMTDRWWAAWVRQRTARGTVPVSRQSPHGSGHIGETGGGYFRSRVLGGLRPPTSPSPSFLSSPTLLPAPGAGLAMRGEETSAETSGRLRQGVCECSSGRSGGLGAGCSLGVFLEEGCG